MAIAENFEERGDPAAWPPEAGDRQALANAALQAHSALQWLARLANSYLPAGPGDSHLELSWRPERGAIGTQEFAGHTSVELRLPQFFLHFRELGKPTLHPVILDDKSPAEVEAWCLIELLHRGIDRDRFSKDLPYDIAGLLKGDADHFETYEREGAFESLAAWLRSSSEILSEALGRAGAGGGPPKVVPQDFSLIAPVEGGCGAVEIGFCLGDSARGPHFYVAREVSEAAGVERLPQGAGRPAAAAKTDVLTMERIVSEEMPREEVVDFLAGAMGPRAG
jgi:hypothetical protein